jgi:CRISPR/Cas system-associated protein Csm6
MSEIAENPSRRAAEADRLLEIVDAIDRSGALIKAAWLAATNTDEVQFAFGEPLAALLDVVSKQLAGVRASASSLHDDITAA